MKNAADVVHHDLAEICNSLTKEFTALNGKHILITGGAGFLGYYLVQAILHWNKTTQSQIQLTVYDNYMLGMPAWLKQLENEPNLTLVKHNVTLPIPKDVGNFHYIIHGASIASPPFYRKYPIETIDANVNGLRHILNYALAQQKKQPVEGILFFSTSEIYGDPSSENIPTPETYNGNVSCTGPRACYDESKRVCETLCVNFAQQHNLPITIVRPFNNYGPGLKANDGRVTADFATNIFNNEDIVLLSDGSPTRTFCYLSDAVIGYYKVLFKGRPGEAYNIGVETPEVSMLQLAEKMRDIAKDMFNYQGNVIKKVSDDKHYLTDNPNRRCPIIQKAQSELGFDQKISLEEGLTRSLIWYRDNK